MTPQESFMMKLREKQKNMYQWNTDKVKEIPELNCFVYYIGKAPLPPENTVVFMPNDEKENMEFSELETELIKENEAIKAEVEEMKSYIDRLIRQRNEESVKRFEAEEQLDRLKHYTEWLKKEKTKYKQRANQLEKALQKRNKKLQSIFEIMEKIRRTN